MTLATLSLLLLRLVVGLTFAAHGAQKAFGWWNGPGWHGWRRAMEAMRFQPAPLWAVVSIAAELGGGVLLAVGLLTPLAAAVLVAQSVVIILKVHLPNGFWNGQKGYEYPLALLAGVVAVLGLGAGTISIDRILGFSLDPALGWLLLVAAIAAGLGSYAISQASAAPRAATQHR